MSASTAFYYILEQQTAFGKKIQTKFGETSAILSFF